MKGFFYDLLGIVVVLGVMIGCIYRCDDGMHRRIDSLLGINDSTTVSIDTITNASSDTLEVNNADVLKVDTIKIVETIERGAKDTIQLTKTNDNVYTLHAKVNGLDMTFILDTGCSDISISHYDRDFMLKHGYLSKNNYKGDGAASLADGTVIDTSVYNISTVEIGKQKIENVVCSVTNDDNNSECLIGQSVLAKLGHVSIDYKDCLLLIY